MTDQIPYAEQPRHRTPLGALRWFLAIVGALAALLSGGCSILVLSDGMGLGLFVLAFGGAPFVLGLLVLWMALTLGRGPAPREPSVNGGQT